MINFLEKKITKNNKKYLKKLSFSNTNIIKLIEFYLIIIKNKKNNNIYLYSNNKLF